MTIWNCDRIKLFHPLIEASHWYEGLFIYSTSASLQVERAFQKQGNVNINKKSLLMSKKKTVPRWYKNIGLGFKTPREVSIQAALFSCPPKLQQLRVNIRCEPSLM